MLCLWIDLCGSYIDQMEILCTMGLPIPVHKFFAASKLDHCSSTHFYQMILTMQMQPIQCYWPPLFFNWHVMISCSHSPHTFHAFLSLHAGLWTKKWLYVNFSHPLQEDIQQPLLFKQATHFSVTCLSFLIHWFYCTFCTEWDSIPIISSTLFPSQDSWDTGHMRCSLQ